MDKENNVVNSNKPNIDIYTNSISVTVNALECLIVVKRDTPDDEDSSIIHTEKLANIRMPIEMADALSNIIRESIDGINKGTRLEEENEGSEA